MPSRHALSWARFLTLPLAIGLFLGGQNVACAQSPYQLKPGREWTLLGAGAALGLSGMAVIHNIDPYTETELAALNSQDVNSFDRAGMHPYREDVAGDVMRSVSLALPLTLLIDERTREDWKTLGVMWGEVLLLQSGLTAITKGLVQRARPYAYDPEAPPEKRKSRDARVSFFSGHTSATAATCFFLASVYSDYPFSKTTKTIAWSAAAVYPAVVGFLRVDSGHHFRTDVITGYVVGAVIGVLIPKLHKTKDTDGVAPSQSLSLDGMRLGFIFRF